jgi:hypothetical protein
MRDENWRARTSDGERRFFSARRFETTIRDDKDAAKRVRVIRVEKVSDMHYK